MHSRGHSFIQFSRNFVRMLLSIKSEPCLKLVHIRSKTRSLGQILVKACVYTQEGTILIQSLSDFFLYRKRAGMKLEVNN